MANGSILLVDDDPILSEMLAACLVERGYDISCTGSLAEARAALALKRPDIVLLDMELPDGSGLSLIPDLGADASLGIIMVTRHGSPADRAKGLETGADDYIAKPYDPGEMLARVSALMRRLNMSKKSDASTHAFRFDGWAIDESRRALVSQVGEEIPLTRSEFIILMALARNANRIMSRQEIMEEANRHWNPTDRTVDVLIGRIRRKIMSLASDDPFVTVYGAGYIFKPGDQRNSGVGATTH
ncbi:MAG TPA: response regulator transcription factor [Azospirillaceae bacterium]|nr:response regulator transcription factor [Azospirillaceae bacterium]